MVCEEVHLARHGFKSDMVVSVSVSVRFSVGVGVRVGVRVSVSVSVRVSVRVTWPFEEPHLARHGFMSDMPQNWLRWTIWPPVERRMLHLGTEGGEGG